MTSTTGSDGISSAESAALETATLGVPTVRIGPVDGMIGRREEDQGRTTGTIGHQFEIEDTRHPVKVLQ